MISYYKQNTNLFKVNSETKAIQQVSNTEDAKSTSWVTKEMAYNGLMNAVEANQIETSTEEEFNTAKQEVLSYLSSL